MASMSKLLLLLLCAYHTLVAQAGDDLRSYLVLPAGSLQSATVNCTDHKAVSPPSGGGVTVPLHHRHGPCSPVPSTKAPTLEEMLRRRRDQLRADYIGRRFSGVKGGGGDVEQSDLTLPTTPGLSLGTLQYVITVGIGSPAVTQTMFIDTGSDVSWTHGCSASRARGATRRRTRSSTPARRAPTPRSPAAPPPARSSARASRETAAPAPSASTLSSTAMVRAPPGPTAPTRSRWAPTPSATSSSGAASLSRASFSTTRTRPLGSWGSAAALSRWRLATQTAGTFGKAFSYCLPPTTGSSGFLTLGASTSGFVVKTPMLRSRQVPAYYGVLLQAIRVGGRQLNIPTSVFSAGSLMDSGTIITRLPRTAYSALSSAFKAGMKQYRQAQPRGILDTCFDFSAQSTISIPSVALVFSGGAVIDLAFNGIILDSCLAFAANRDDSSLGIIGNVQQRTFEVLYDVGGGAVGFKAGAC